MLSVGAGIGALLAANSKIIPGSWHSKIALYFIKHLYIQGERRPESVFDSQTLHTICQLPEIDMYGHKSNSTYLADLDFSRLKLLTYQFRRTFRSHNSPGMQRGYFEWIKAPVASANICYLAEIKPFQLYNVRSRIFGWDRKWIFVLSTFEGKHGLHAYALSKFVLKQQRKTVPPLEAFEVEGTLTEQALRQNETVQKYLEEALDLETIIDLVDPTTSKS